MTVLIENENGERVTIEVTSLEDVKVAQAFIVDGWKKRIEAQTEQAIKEQNCLGEIYMKTGCANVFELDEILTQVEKMMGETDCNTIDEMLAWVREHNFNIDEKVDEIVCDETHGEYESLEDLIESEQNMSRALSDIYDLARDYYC